MRIRHVLLEGLPLAALIGAAGILFAVEWLRGMVLAPLGLGLLVVTVEATRHAVRAREDGTNALVAAIDGASRPLGSAMRAYFSLGLWRGRVVYDVAAGSAFLVGAAWWFLDAAGASASTARWLCAAPLFGAIGGAWLRYRDRRISPSPLLADVMLALDGWEHKRRRADEFAYENAIATRLRECGLDAAQGQRLDGGREADIIVRPKGSIGDWNWRDVMIEMKAHLKTTNERDRALGQLETYSAAWPGPIVLMICGDHRADLLRPLKEKVTVLCQQGRFVAMVVKGRPAA